MQKDAYAAARLSQRGGKSAPTVRGVLKMADRKVNILGTPYTISERSEADDPLLQGCDGYCDWTTKTIVAEREMVGTLGDMDVYVRKVIRHEIVHAFLFESGLQESTFGTDAWARNEEMVDWLARQGPKIYEAWKEAGALDGEGLRCNRD